MRRGQDGAVSMFHMETDSLKNYVMTMVAINVKMVTLERATNGLNVGVELYLDMASPCSISASLHKSMGECVNSNGSKSSPHKLLSFLTRTHVKAPAHSHSTPRTRTHACARIVHT